MRVFLCVDAARMIILKKLKKVLATCGASHLIPLITFKHLSPQGDGVISNEIENKTGRVGVRGPFPFPDPTVRGDTTGGPNKKASLRRDAFFVGKPSAIYRRTCSG